MQDESAHFAWHSPNDVYSSVTCYCISTQKLSTISDNIQSTLVVSNFTGPYTNVRVISSSRQPNCDVIGMTTVRLSVRQNVLGRHMYMAI